MDLALGSEDSDDVGGGLLVRETDLRIGLRLNVVNKDTLLPQEGTVVLARDRNGLINVILILSIYQFRHKAVEGGAHFRINQLHHRLF